MIGSAEGGARPIQPGQDLLHYRIVEKIGEGGMGVVWKALDTDLEREVAIKILPQQFVADAERLARFEREAKLLASLNHPNIAGVYGLHTAGGVRFLAMELVQGEDLQKRLARGPLAMDDAMDVAVQIARALEAAQTQGIVHRDLKPANIIRGDNGTVKVLDFGLAKALSPDPASGEANPSLSPTMTSAGTVAGMILGTAAYMSPEQARGRPTDARADLWAFGAVLMEMITGKQVFAGETVSDILASVLKSEPDWDLLPADTPRPARRLLRRCLRKDADTRLHHPADARIEIEAARSRPDPIEMAGTAAVAAEPLRKPTLQWVLAAIALVAVIGFALREFNRPDPTAEKVSYRFDLRYATAGRQRPEISPDGRRFAYAAIDGDEQMLFVRSFSEEAGRLLPGTSGFTGGVFWSPDGSSLGYFSEDSVERISIEGGPPTTVCKIPGGWASGDWSSNGSILVEIATNPDDNGWYLCRQGNAAVEKLERPLPLETGQVKSWPAFLPDGDHFVFVHHLNGIRQAVLTRLGSGNAQALFPTDTQVIVGGDGWYLFARKGQLLAQRFDPETYLPLGDPRTLAERVDMFEPNARVILSVSDQSTLMYQTGETTVELTWFDRDGRELGPALESGEYRSSALSPDGRLLALHSNDPRSGTSDLWVHDLERGLPNRLTNTAWAEFRSVWSLDSRQIAYSADPEGPPNLFVVGIDGGTPRKLVPMNGKVQYATDWTKDGKTILFMMSDPKTSSDLWAVDAAGGEPRELIRTEFSEYEGVVSPDGRWLAYGSRSSGRSEIYLQPFGGDGPRQRVSVDGGWSPKWDGDRVLFFRAPDQKLMTVELAIDGDRLTIGKPRTVIALDGQDMNDYNLHPDGRILIAHERRDQGIADTKVMVGWD